MQKKLSGLGRGLGSLIPQKSAPAVSDAVSPAIETASPRADASDMVLRVPVADIAANPEQPRQFFHRAELEDLMNSVREHGIIQPLTVTRRAEGGYELIAGERRLRAATMLGLATVPVIVRAEETDDDKLVLALIENIQRADLNAVEEARAYARLVDEFSMTQEDVAKQVGKARPTVANMLRLLELPAEIQEGIASGAISAGSARALLALPDDEARLAHFRRLQEQKLSTRDVEAGVRKAKGSSLRDPAVVAAEENLRDSLGARVDIKKRNGQGTIAISFYSDDEFEGIVGTLLEPTSSGE